MQVNLLSCITERNKHYTVCELISHLVQKKFNVMRTFRTLRDWLKPKTRAFGMNYGDYWNSIDHQSENIFPHITNKLLFHKHTSTYTYSSWFFFPETTKEHKDHVIFRDRVTQKRSYENINDRYCGYFFNYNIYNSWYAYLF